MKKSNESRRIRILNTIMIIIFSIFIGFIWWLVTIDKDIPEVYLYDAPIPEKYIDQGC